MANTRISDLTASASNLASTDLAPVVQTAGVGPVKMTGAQIAAGLLSATTPIGSGPILSAAAAATLQLGAADAAAPVAQTFKVQSVVGSTPGASDVAGANFTIQGSAGRGSGAGGSIIFQVAPAGSAGTGAQNAYSTALTIATNGSITANVGLFYVGGTTHSFRDCTTSSPKFSNGNSSCVICLGASSGNVPGLFVTSNGTEAIGWLSGNYNNAPDLLLYRDAANTLALRNGTNPQEKRVYASYTSSTNYQRTSIKTLRESSGALSGATYVSTIAIPAYAVLIGVTTRVTTTITGATTYDVGDGTDVDLWGAAIGVAAGSQSRTADFTAVAATGAAATSRTVTLTANGSNFTGGVVEICLHYLTTEAD